jgi:hypothetical protein
VSVLEDWLDEVVRGLELDPDSFDRDLLLDLTRDVAHGVARPAAPLTAYLAGLAVGRAGGSHASLEEVVRRIGLMIEGREPVADPPAPQAQAPQDR